MPKYLALITGVGEGCDYTIGCNKNWEVGEAENKEVFIKEILENYGMLYYDSGWCEPNIDKIEVFEIKDESFPVNNLAKWYEIQYDEYHRKQKEEKERLEYERLKAKYEE